MTPGYYVLADIEGNECVLFHRATLAEAKADLFAEQKRDPLLGLSIAEAGGRLVVTVDRDGAAWEWNYGRRQSTRVYP